MAEEAPELETSMQIEEADGGEPKIGRRRRSAVKEVLATDPNQELEGVRGDMNLEELQEQYKERYKRSDQIQRRLLELGIPKPKKPLVPELIRDEDGEVKPPTDITHLSSLHLGEYHAYYTAMLEWVGRLLWIADVDAQTAQSVRKEVEGFFELEPDVQQYGHRDERVAKRDRRKTVHFAQRVAEEKETMYKALEREYERFSRLSFMVSREITRREKRTEDDL